MVSKNKKLKIALTSDLHWGAVSRANPEIEKLGEQITQEPPDAIVVLGDIGTGKENFTRALAPFSGFSRNPLEIFVKLREFCNLAGVSAYLMVRKR